MTLSEPYLKSTRIGPLHKNIHCACAKYYIHSLFQGHQATINSTMPVGNDSLDELYLTHAQLMFLWKCPIWVDFR